MNTASQEPSPSAEKATRDPTARAAADALEAVLRPIVEGQVRSFCNDHPSIVSAVNWFKPREDRAQTLVNSIAKRIMGNLLCAETRVRLVAALSGMLTADCRDGVCGTTYCARPAGGGTATAPGGRSRGGHARAAALTPERRSEIARAAAAARWGSPAISGSEALGPSRLTGPDEAPGTNSKSQAA